MSPELLNWLMQAFRMQRNARGPYQNPGNPGPLGPPPPQGAQAPSAWTPWTPHPLNKYMADYAGTGGNQSRQFQNPARTSSTAPSPAVAQLYKGY
jgi:hypothetical protein